MSFKSSIGRTAGSLNALESPTRRPELGKLSTPDLCRELFARLDSGDGFEHDQDLVLAGQLYDLLTSQLDVHLNRFSRRRLYDVVRPVLDAMSPSQLKNGTVVDLGSGSLNPFAFSFVLLMLGARRAYTIDLEPVQDFERAVRALAAAAAWMLVRPDAVVGEHAIERQAMLGNLEGFDLSGLDRGDRQALASDRLIYRIESVYDLTIADGEADIVSSVSLLEHVDRLDDALATLRRITKRGGLGHHIVDFVDHRLYGGEVDSPFEFLKIDSTDLLVHGCNRIRCHQLCQRFEQYGFLVERIEPTDVEPLTDAEQAEFVQPFRSMSKENLTTLCARIVVRRR
jgi:SAM-dependent methyltransferase